MPHRPSALSLKGRALQLLAQREQSRAELRRKLLPYAALEDLSTASAAADAPSSAGPPHAAAHRCASERRPLPVLPQRPTLRQAATLPAAVARVDSLLDWLEANHHLSEARFVESRVHSRSARYGNLRIRQELAQHRIDLPDAAGRALQDSEPVRAQLVWQRKFGAPPADAAARARQMRFLAGRGFSADTVRRAVPAVERAGRTMPTDEDGPSDGMLQETPDD